MRLPTVFLVTLLVACTGSVDGPDTLTAEPGTTDSPAEGDAEGGDAEAPSTPEVPSPDDTPGPTLTACSQSSAVLCDDFEAATVGDAPQAPWSTSLSGGTAAIDATRAYSGTQAVKLTTQAGSSKRALITVGAPSLPLPGNVVFGRMMFWLEAPPGNTTHWNNVDASGTIPGDSTQAHYRYGGQYDGKMMANYDSSPKKSDCWRHSKTVIPSQRWACFEWEFDGPDNTMHAWLDGEPLSDITIVEKGDGCINHDLSDKWLAPTFQSIALGWQHYQNLSNSVTMWLDDVAIDDQRIGCPQAP